MTRPKAHSPKYVGEIIDLALGYEDIASLTVGDITVIKGPPKSYVDHMVAGENPYPDAPSYDELTADYVAETEGPDNE